MFTSNLPAVMYRNARCNVPDRQKLFVLNVVIGTYRCFDTFFVT